MTPFPLCNEKSGMPKRRPAFLLLHLIPFSRCVYAASPPATGDVLLKWPSCECPEHDYFSMILIFALSAMDFSKRARLLWTLSRVMLFLMDSFTSSKPSVLAAFRSVTSMMW